MIKDVKHNSEGSAMDTVESNEESSCNSGVSQRSKQLRYFLKNILISKSVSNINNVIECAVFCCLSEFNGEICK